MDTRMVMTLEVSLQKMRLNEQSIEIYCLNTVFRGRIGEWIELGGVIQKRKGSEASIGKGTATHNDESRKVFLN
jgi:hypothetical protein